MNFVIALQVINLSVRFFLEIGALLVAGYWGFKTGNTGWMKGLLGIGIPLVMAVLWGLMGSPKAPVQLSVPFRFLLETVVFGLPVLFLFSLGKISPTWIYGVIVVINRILMWVWEQ